AYLVSRQWDLFKDSFAGMFTVTGALLAAAALALSKVVHELGHAYATKNLGLRVPTMGVSLMCFAPVLWTDTTEAWKLPRRRDRLHIGAAGVSLELALATLAALLWPIMPPGDLKTAVFITASTIWIMTLAVNVNPCMRYDGYYLLSDHWNIPDLQSRAFALGKWRLREFLFGFGLPPPERFAAWDREKMIVYAYVTWVYRFFLFLGIALMMYTLLFKALGVVLMVVELVFFLAAPVWREVMQWVGMRSLFRFNYRTIRTGVVFLGGLALFFLPWHRQIIAPAIAVPSRQTLVHAPAHGFLDEVAAANFHRYSAGETLARLRSPDLESKIGLAEMRIATQLETLSLASLDRQIRTDLAADWEELGRMAEDLGGLLKEKEQLHLTAPLTGTIRDLAVWVTPGQWLAVKEPLALMAGENMNVEAYVPEAELDRIAVGQTGLFYPAGRGRLPVAVTVVSVESRATRELAHVELSSTAGGPLAAQKSPSGALVPDHAVFKVVCAADISAAAIVTGQVSLSGQPQSFASRLWHNFMGLVIRESNLN
ncbi:MAG: efflux RND transporter periplasmic adaptor subunit, partial [Planctomycetes bacterium]|nr:efflux RND transporter periplasmic adaptor subunit [Planctomycetota bacterium]